ncbi:MAG: FlgO family outer membrane protein [Syntrophales bacterium]|jgi:hypothetical protein
MKSFKMLIPLFFISFLFACATVPDKGKEQPIQLFAVEGTVLECSGAKLVLSIKIPDFSKTSNSVVEDIANQVVRKSYLLEGTKISIDEQEGVVTEVRGNQVKMTFDQALPYTPGRKVSVQVPKKTIAVVDFEVIGGNRKEKGRVVLEGLTSALIDTGQFIVVERTKLQPIMNEIQLSLSGMTKRDADGMAGKLLSADLILTGTLTDLQEEWEINLRILNVRTGQALSSVAMKTRLFKQMEMRDSGSWGEDFEGSTLDPSWIVRSEATGAKKHKKAIYSVHLDSTQGAEDSHKSLRIDFDFSGEQDFYAMASNRKKRDLTLYNGAEFFVKGTETLNGQFYILTSHPDNPNKIDQWTGIITIDKNWKKIRIPFDQLIISRGWIKGGAQKLGAIPGDQVMRLNRLEGIQFGIGSDKNEGLSGSMWIDKIRLYSD